MREELKQQADRAFAALFESARRQRSTSVDVRATHDDAELDDHLWMRIGDRVGDDQAGVGLLPDELRAYYVTRFFEWEYGSGGITGFLDWGATIAPYVADAYHLLGLSEAAAAFEKLWSLPVVHRLATDEAYEPTEREMAEIDELADVVGSHDDERVAFVRRHPDEFSV